MKQKHLYTALLLFIVSLILSQDTYWKYFDMSQNNGSEEPYDMHIKNDTIYMWGNGTCNGSSCMHYYIFSKEGEILLFEEYPGIVAGRRVAFQDSIFYLPIRYSAEANSGYDGFRLGKFDIKGELLKSQKYNLQDFPNAPEFEDDDYFQYGNVVFGNKIVVYGEVIDRREDRDIWQTCMFWYNKDMSLDTIIFISPENSFENTWDAHIDQNGLLTLLCEYRIHEPGSQTEEYLVYVKYDKTGELIDFWDAPEWSGRFLHMPMFITSENEVILYKDDETRGIKSEVHKINPSGQIKWQEHLDGKQTFTDRRGILDLRSAQDGSILGCGLMTSTIAKLYGAHLFKLDKGTGELLWERTYTDWRNTLQAPSPLQLDFFNVGELSDGSLILSGFRKNTGRVNGEPFFNKDLLIMRLDADGCLEPGCGGTIHHLAGEPVYDHMLSVENLKYYQKQGTIDGIIKLVNTPFDPGTFGEWYTEKHLDPREERHYENIISEIYRIEADGRKIYYTGNNKDELLYDFTLEVGDIFESEYIDQPLEVIESDTMRLSNRAKMRYWVLACTENPENTITWLEKIGTYQGVQWPRNFCDGDYGDKNLTCFYRYERLAHMNPDVEDCLMPTSTDAVSFIQLSKITAVPNPTTDLITISAPNELNIERTDLLDTQGRTHAQVYEHTSEVVIDLSGYPSGLYYISVYTSKGSVVKKVVKM